MFRFIAEHLKGGIILRNCTLQSEDNSNFPSQYRNYEHIQTNQQTNQKLRGARHGQWFHFYSNYLANNKEDSNKIITRLYPVSMILYQDHFNIFKKNP